jgi:hypothetical protein
MEILMRSLLSARSARLVLAAAAVAALGATTTACDPDTSAAGSSASPAAAAPASSAPAAASAPAADSSSPAAAGASEKPIDTDAVKKKYYGQSCGTNDLTFTVSEKSQAGGYLLVTAKAKSGITCYLEGNIPSASFGSDPDTMASNAEQAVSDTVKLSGSKAAYAGISSKSTNTNDGKQFGLLIIAITGFETDAVDLKIPDTIVDKPIATNWHANPADAVPFTS